MNPIRSSRGNGKDMERKTMTSLIAIVVIVAFVMFAGCIEEEFENPNKVKKTTYIDVENTKIVFYPSEECDQKFYGINIKFGEDIFSEKNTCMFRATVDGQEAFAYSPLESKYINGTRYVPYGVSSSTTNLSTIFFSCALICSSGGFSCDFDFSDEDEANEYETYGVSGIVYLGDDESVCYIGESAFTELQTNFSVYKLYKPKSFHEDVFELGTMGSWHQ